MNADFKSAIAAVALALLILPAVAQPAPGEDGLPGTGVAGDDDPRILESEVVAPSIDSRDPAWVPAYESNSGETGVGKGTDSIACGGRDACEDYKEEQRSSSSTTGAPK